MAFEVTRKVFDTGTGAIGTKIAVTGAPSEPKALILKIVGNVGSANGVTGQNIRHCVGFAAKRSAVITQGVNGAAVADGVGTTSTRRWSRDDACLSIFDDVGIETGGAFLDTMDANGFTLEVDDPFDQSYRVEVLMLGGSDLTDAEVKNWFIPTVIGNFDITVYSFQPDCMLLHSYWDPKTPLPDDRAGGGHSLGVLVGTTQQGYLGHRDQSALATTDCVTSCHQGSECLAETRTTVRARLAFVSFLSNGVRLNLVEDDNADRVFGLALKGGDYSVKEMLTQTDTVTDIDVTGLPSEPSGGLVLSGYRTEDAVNTQQVDHRGSFGFWDGASQGVQAMYGENGVGTSNVATGQRNDAVYQSITNAPAQDGAMAFISKAATSAKFRMIDADPSSRFTFGLFFGPAPVVVTPASGKLVRITDAKPRLTRAIG